MNRYLGAALGWAVCALALAAAAVLPYRAMAAQDAAALPLCIPCPALTCPQASRKRPRKAMQRRRCMPVCAYLGKPTPITEITAWAALPSLTTPRWPARKTRCGRPGRCRRCFPCGCQTVLFPNPAAHIRALPLWMNAVSSPCRTGR